MARAARYVKQPPTSDNVQTWAEREFEAVERAIGRLSDRLFVGAGSPLNVVVANVGSLYLRTDGGTNTTLYVKESGDGASTGWVAK